jgi:hypothetical protein
VPQIIPLPLACIATSLQHRFDPYWSKQAVPHTTISPFCPCPDFLIEKKEIVSVCERHATRLRFGGMVSSDDSRRVRRLQLLFHEATSRNRASHVCKCSQQYLHLPDAVANPITMTFASQIHFRQAGDAGVTFETHALDS